MTLVDRWLARAVTVAAVKPDLRAESEAQQTGGTRMTRSRFAVLGRLMAAGMVLGLAGCATQQDFSAKNNRVNAAEVSPSEAGQHLRKWMRSGPGGKFEFENGNTYVRVNSVRITLSRLDMATDDGDVTVPLRNFGSLACKGRDKGIRVAGVLNCGRYHFAWTNENTGIAGTLSNALASLSKEAARIFSVDDEERFNRALEQYRSATPKPALSEDMRRVKVEAEGAIRDKEFLDAERLYLDVLGAAPWWAEGHFNLALISGEMRDYDLAAREMKRYLLLVPDAPNARAAQDKIYYWQRKAASNSQ